MGIRAKRKRKKDAIGIAIILVCFVALILGFSFYFSNKNDVKRDLNLCKEKGPDGIVVVLLDKTEPLQEIQQIEVKSLLLELKDSLPKDYKISIYAIEDDLKQIPQVKIELCNPGDGSDSSFITSNPELIKKRWVKEYSDKINQVVKDNEFVTTINKSMIIEAIKYISIQEFLGKNKDSVPKKLYIVSDMMQNSETYSQYKDTQQQSISISSNMLSNLKDVDVEIFYIYRQNLERYQNKSHIEFWQKLIGNSGGRLISVKKI